MTGLDDRTKRRPIDPVEERRSQIRKEAQDKLVQTSWIAVSSVGSVTLQSNTVSISPGTNFFNTVPSSPGSFTAPIAHVAMSGTRIPNEALRRAMVILAAAKTRLLGPTYGGERLANEEMAFLASQAALALEGAPLQVIVSGGNAVDAARAAEALRPIIAQLGQHQTTLQRASAARAQTLKAYSALKKEQDADGIDPQRNIKKHSALAETYEQTSKQASAAKKELEHDKQQVEYVIDGKK